MSTARPLPPDTHANGARVTDAAPMPINANSDIDATNSTFDALDADATWPGGWVDVREYAQVVIRCSSDVAGTGYFESSRDGINQHGTSVQLNAGDAAPFIIADFGPTTQYMRVRYVNGPSAQSSFFLSVRLNRIPQRISNSATQSVDDYSRVQLSRVVTDPFLDEVSGKQSDRQVVQKFGSNPSVAAGTAELITQLGTGFGGFLTTATAVRVKAGNTNDTAGGSGARAVVIEGLDENFVEQTSTIATNGTSASDATSETYIRINRAYVTDCGTYSADGTAQAAADIVIENAAGSADLIMISSDLGQSEQSIYTVPAGKVAYIREISGSSASGKVDGQLRLMQRRDADVTSAPFTCPRIVYPVRAFSGFFERAFKTYLGGFPAKTDLYFLGVGPTGGSEMSATMDIVLVNA